MLTGGVAVACGDIDNDGNDEILTTPGPLTANPPWMKAWNHDGVAISLNENKSFVVPCRPPITWISMCRGRSTNFSMYTVALPKEAPAFDAPGT